MLLDLLIIAFGCTLAFTCFLLALHYNKRANAEADEAFRKFLEERDHARTEE